MNELYPLKFHPQLKDKIWGGQRMKKFNFDFNGLPNCGEAWLISGIEENESVVANGWLQGNTLAELMEVYMEELVGDKVYERYGEHFPLLIKILDANDWLSIQVHPNDKMAQRKGFPNGKTEMWYVLQAEQDAEIITGFSRDTNKEEFSKLLAEKNLDSVLNRVKVSEGDVFYTPAGRIHALGPGIMLAEIQQSSDLTYRVYDFDRPGLDGRLRELHLNEALEALDYNKTTEVKTDCKPALNKSQAIINQECFASNMLRFNNEVVKNLSSLDSFVIYLCISGHIEVLSNHKCELLPVEALLVPACLEMVKLNPLKESLLMEIYIA